MTIDISEFENVKSKLSKCKVARVLDELGADNEQYLKLITALSVKNSEGAFKIGAESICRVIKSWGFSLSGKTIALHRSAMCCCFSGLRVDS